MFFCGLVWVGIVSVNELLDCVVGIAMEAVEEAARRFSLVEAVAVKAIAGWRNGSYLLEELLLRVSLEENLIVTEGSQFVGRLAA